MSALFVCLVICCFILPAHSYQLNKALCEGSLCLYLYEAGNTYLTWSQSHTACREEGLEMLRIESNQTQTTVDRLLQDLAQSTARQIWIGGRESSDDTWRYMNGTEFDKTTTTETDPYPYCIHVNLCKNHSPRYVADNCDEKRSTSRVLCQYDKSRTGQCRSQDYEFGDKCYVKTQYNGSDPNKIDWYSGQTYCSQSSIQGDIAYSYLDDSQHINDVVSFFYDDDGDGCVVLWLGVRRRMWFWKTDSGSDTSGQVIDYFNWFDEDTPIPSSDADCIYIDGDKGNKWRAQSCTGSPLNYFICMNASTATTTTTTTTRTTTGTITTTTTASTSANQSEDSTNSESGNKNQMREQSGDDNSNENRGTSVVISAAVVSVVVLAVGIGLAVFFVMRRKKRHPNTHHYVNDGIQPSLDNQTKSKESEYAAVDIDTDNNDDVIDPYGTTSANNQPTPLINHSEAPSGDLYALSTKQANKMKENLNRKALKEKINKEKMESKESDRSEVRKYEEGPAGDLYAMPAKKNNKTPSDTNSD